MSIYLKSKYEGLDKNQRERLKAHKRNYIKKCKWCNCEFDIYGVGKMNWSYKLGYSGNANCKWFCSYTCLNEYLETKCGNYAIDRKKVM